MRKGDFTQLASHYQCRPGYSHSILERCFDIPLKARKKLVVVDIGAGTGKLTQDLFSLGFAGYAIEPNKAMFEIGKQACPSFRWLQASAEKTTLDDSCADFITMGSSFHWTDKDKALAEFYRVLKPGGHFIALWNPRDLSASPLQMEIDLWIRKRLKGFSRTSSGASSYTQNLEQELTRGGYFSNVRLCEGKHQEIMSKERYLGAWKSVNDIQAQAGDEGFREILVYIENKIAGLDEIVMPYKTRAYIALSKKSG